MKIEIKSGDINTFRGLLATARQENEARGDDKDLAQDQMITKLFNQINGISNKKRK